MPFMPLFLQYVEQAVIPRSALWQGAVALTPRRPANLLLCLKISWWGCGCSWREHQRPDAALCPPAAPARVVI